MPDPFQPVRQGDSLAISARSMNGLLDAGKNRSRSKLDENQQQAGPGVPQPTRIYNALDAALDAFNVVQTSISEIVLDAAAVPLEAAAAPILNADTPAEDGRPFFVTREAIPVGGIGEVVTNGPAVVRVNVTDAGHEFAAVSAGITGYLVSSATDGAPILWKESGTGLKTALVQLGGSSADPDASPTVRGYVSTGTQKFEGIKYARSGFVVGDNVSSPSVPLPSLFLVSSGGLGATIRYNSVTYNLDAIAPSAGSLFSFVGLAYAINISGTVHTGRTTDVTLSGGTVLTFSGGLLTGVAGPTAPDCNWTSDVPTPGDWTIAAPTTVHFTDLSTGVPTTWAWDFGDGGTSSGQNPTHTYTVPGTYTVTLTVSNAYGSDFLTFPAFITVT